MPMSLNASSVQFASITRAPQTIVELPGCVTGCIASEVPRFQCQPANATCICLDQELNAAVEACLVTHCTVIESLQARKQRTISCGERVRVNPRQEPLLWTLFSVTLLAVTARLIVKVPSLNPVFRFSWDDCFIVTSMLALLAVDICSQMAIDRGFGQDIWMLSAGNITDILQIFFVEEILYAITITTTKTSIVMFYLRIFQEPSFRTVCFATQCTNVTFGAWHIMQILFTTTPISYNWTFWDEQHSGTRGNVRLFSFINGGINIALDLWLFILPVTQLVAMSWTMRTKIGTSLIFLTGLIVTVSSCIRLETLAEFGLSRNPTYDLVGLSTWSLVELHLSVICACLPGMRLLFRRLSPALRRRRLPKDLTHNRPRTGRFIPRVLSRFVSLVTEPDDLDNRSIRGSVVTEVGTTRYWTPPAHRDHEVSGRAESAVQSMVERGKSDPSIPTSGGSV